MKKNLLKIFVAVFLILFLIQESFASDASISDEIIKVRNILEDEYSKNVFDSYYLYETREQKENIPHNFSDFKENNHPDVPVKRGDIVVDVGISGWVELTEDFIKLTGKNGLVIGIEANPNLFGKITEQIGNYENFKLYIYALSNHNGRGRFDVGKDYDGDETYKCGSIAKSLYSQCKADDYIYVDFIKLDKFIKKYNIKNIDYLKLDIEGSELDALKGAKKTLKKFKPKLAISVHYNREAVDIIKYINKLKLNYKIYFAEIDSLSIYWRNYIIYATARD